MGRKSSRGGDSRRIARHKAAQERRGRFEDPMQLAFFFWRRVVGLWDLATVTLRRCRPAVRVSRRCSGLGLRLCGCAENSGVALLCASGLKNLLQLPPGARTLATRHTKWSDSHHHRKHPAPAPSPRATRCTPLSTLAAWCAWSQACTGSEAAHCKLLALQRSGARATAATPRSSPAARNS